MPSDLGELNRTRYGLGRHFERKLAGMSAVAYNMRPVDKAHVQIAQPDRLLRLE